MEWCKLYARLPRDRDLRRAGEGATLLFVFGLCYCAEEETDGFIPDDALPDFRLPNVLKRAEALVRVGVWKRASDGYLIPNWEPKQKELYAIMRKRQKDADRMAAKRKQSRDSRTTSRATVAPESREEKNSRDLGSSVTEVDARLLPLRTALDDVRLVVRWDRLDPNTVDRIAWLADVHGIPALVAAAQRAWQRDDPPAFANAWLKAWDSLPLPKPRLVAAKCDLHALELPCVGCAADAKAAAQ